MDMSMVCCKYAQRGNTVWLGSACMASPRIYSMNSWCCSRGVVASRIGLRPRDKGMSQLLVLCDMCAIQPESLRILWPKTIKAVVVPETEIDLGLRCDHHICVDNVVKRRGTNMSSCGPGNKNAMPNTQETLPRTVFFFSHVLPDFTLLNMRPPKWRRIGRIIAVLRHQHRNIINHVWYPKFGQLHVRNPSWHLISVRSRMRQGMLNRFYGCLYSYADQQWSYTRFRNHLSMDSFIYL